MNLDPLQEYATRLSRWRTAESLLQRQFVRIGNWRLAVALAAVAIAWLAFGPGYVTPWLLLPILIAFVGLVVWHQRVIRQRTRAARAARFYQRGLDRIEDNWMGTGPFGDEFRDPSHVYADDLDLFGKGSLFELISRARTSAGENTLAQWLLSPADRSETGSRQDAVRELTPRLDLREHIAALGEDIRANVHAGKMAAWGSAEPVAFLSALRWIAPALAILGIFAVLGLFAQVVPLFVLALILLCDFTLMFGLRHKIASIVTSVDTAGHDLRIFALILERLEAESFASEKLRGIRAALVTEGTRASKRVARLEFWVDLLDSRDHLLVRVLQPLLLWREQVAMNIEMWRQRNGSQIGSWLTAVGEFEALSSFAAVAFERPDWKFPELVDTSEALFDAEALRHPLIAQKRCVGNDVSIGGELRLLVISGSNMSGKSTLLRAIGLNTVLAWAGATVPAARLRISRLQTGASTRIVDSLQDNRSRFFAEITRLRQIVDLTGSSVPVLFLLDELLSGTNSHDRRIGASAIVRGLIDSGAIGLITTHDLALADVVADLGARAANAHFQDTVVEGQMGFDYRLYPGVVTRSNALELMRAIGLTV